ncbi:hypothetical protein B0H67DRAFT_302660 [Lasiosphaeris hirsuta]|uniref:Uncharacterized protein n=1 Tax=Lasiosphaeris hirsuta TaxID=260670 RepID=A0AA40A9S0_9PEZI|nr:hypothetical protein B0H67DRAFT_302660 [Lasiosphaeris hirsuta]
MAYKYTPQGGCGSSPGTSAPSSRPSSPPLTGTDTTTTNAATSSAGSNSDVRSQFVQQQRQKNPASSLKNALPAWALAIQEQQETLEQPWKVHFSGADPEDDASFAQGPDTVMFYDERVKVCYGEGSMAA